MTRTMLALGLPLALTAGCVVDATDDDGGGSTGAGTTAGTTTAGTTTAGTTTDGTTTTDPTAGEESSTTDDPTGGGAGVCWAECATVDDCCESVDGCETYPLNYACEDSLCVYLGCETAADCGGDGWECTVEEGIGACQQTCETVDDCCVVPGGCETYPTNFACEGNLCVNLGCAATEDCTDIGEGWDCWIRDGFGQCSPTCETIDDCPTEGEYGLCDGGWCQFDLSCETTDECAEGEVCVQ